MKEKIKRLFASIAAILMAIGLIGANAVPVFAETVTNSTDHSYTAYQIFSGTQAANSEQLGDVQWGSGINSSDFLTALQADDNFKVNSTNIFASATSAQEVAGALESNTNGVTDSPLAKEFANVAAKYTTGTGTSIEANATSVTLSSGYYLIVDNTSNPSDGAYNSALLQVTGGTGISITKKYTVPEFDKNIVRNDEAVATGKAVDRNIGDTVNYELSGTVPTNLADYDTYKYVFHDTLSVGQKIDVSSIKVYLVTEGGTDQEITDSFTKNKITSSEGTETSATLTSDNAGNGSEPLTFTVGIDNLKTITNVSSTTRIIVRYTATLTSDAAIGNSGNNNEGYLEYSNNPNGTGEGTTVHKNTYVYTYQLDVTKKDGEGNDATVLPNAQFVLKATNGIHNGKYVQIDASTGKLTGWLDTKPTEVETKPTAGNTGVLVSGTDGKVSVIGLDAGSYELEEIKAPAGYNKLTSTIPVTITATIEDDNANSANTTSALTTLKINQDQSNYATDGKLPLTVVNNAGSVLPSTGGIGTTIFYVAGGILIIGAAVLLVARRKRNA